MKKHSFFISILLLLLSMSVFSQNIMLRGEVRRNDQEAIDYYNIELLSLSPDTIIIFGGTYLTPHFRISENLDSSTLIRISSMGYETQYKNIGESQDTLGIDIGVIYLKPLPFELSELVVTGKRPPLKMKDGNIVVNVPNTMLSHSGNLIDLLKKTPGVIMSGEKHFTVVGRREQPLILINNREIKDVAELESLRSIDVESIEIDKNPSSKYAASVKSIIHIRTRFQLKDMISAQIANDTYLKRNVSDNPSMRLAYRKGIMSSMLSYNYGYLDDKIYETSYKDIYYENYTLSNSLDYKSRSKLNYHTVLMGADLLLGKSRLGVQYLYRESDRRANKISQNTILKDLDTVNKEIRDRSNLDRTLHSVSLNYVYERSKNSELTLISDFARASNTTKNLIDEKNQENQSTTQVD